VDDLAAWLRDRRYYQGQIIDERTVPGAEPEFADVDLEPRLESALAERGVERLYRHQAEAIEAVREGDDVVLATPTASGKSLAYTVPAFERAMDHGGRTLYVAPQNALIADQEETLSDLARGLGFGSRVSVAQYTGRQSKSEKRAVRDRQPTVVLSNPDMLHYALLPYAHRLWDWFFSSLETVVIDEVHEYRGVFGSHVALVLRRLARVCDQFDAAPQFVCCSATIGNPVEHAAAVTGRPEASFALVDRDDSGTGPKHWLTWNPPLHDNPGPDGSRRRSSHVEAKTLFVDLVTRGHQTLVFTRARQTAERYAQESARDLGERSASEQSSGERRAARPEGVPPDERAAEPRASDPRDGERDLADSVAAYQAALTDSRRRDLEADLQSGDLRGVWSTNALELGVDVGGLDAVVLDGYPGTRMNAFQQAGRAGRGTDDSLVVLVAGEDQLDQYVATHPDDLFEGDPEDAIVNPGNDQLLADHVRCAASENWLSTGDDAYFGDAFPGVVADLEDAGDLDRRDTAQGVRWTYDGDASPQHDMNLRSIGDRDVTLRDDRDGSTVGTLPLEDALRDAHPGAIYHHQGRKYEVTDLDLDRDEAVLSPTWADYYTRVLTEKTITVEADLDEKRPLARDDAVVRFADVTMRSQVTGYERKDAASGETLGHGSLSLPEQTLRTKALYYTVPGDVEDALREAAADDDGDGGGFPGAIHAAEHAMISMFPLSFLCDRRDVGGLSTPIHPHTGRSTVFIYDGYPGGVGLARAGYGDVSALADRTLSMLRACDCASGCPACVQSPQCGNANEPLDKALAIRLLDALAEENE
jgi:DEAD/DEAH box helicase domain-containing protein